MWAGVVTFQNNIPSVYADSASSIDTQFPAWAKPNPTQDITDLNYRKQTLPVQDQSAAGFVVYPKEWVTIPLVRPDKDDLEKIKVGDIFNHFKYLENGALHYVGNAPDQGIWNMVLAAHSSFNESDPGRYKTAGQVAINSSIGDKVHVYLADENGFFTLYVYTIQRSEEVLATQVSILDQNVTQETLTFFTCFPIWTTLNRWINKAVLTETIQEKDRYSPPAIQESAKVQPLFSTQSVTKSWSIKKTTQSKATQEHGSAPIEQDKIEDTKPTFKERVLYRPIVYRTTIKLVSSVWFKRSNLQKLIDLLDQKIESLDSTPAKEKNRKLTVIFILIKELVEGFMK